MKPDRFVGVRGFIRDSAAVSQPLIVLFVTLLLTGCGEVSQARRTVDQVGPEKLRREMLAACREGFAIGGVQKVPESNWPESGRPFSPLGLWAEPDGAYLLTESDAGGERGIYLPRILSEKDPLCGPTLTHVKLAPGVYWYDRKR